MSGISDINFQMFLNEEININNYVITSSLELVERTNYNLFMRRNEINKEVVCIKLGDKFDAYLQTRLLTSNEKQQAIKNLEVLQSKFSGSAQHTDTKCYKKLQKVIATIISSDVRQTRSAHIDIPQHSPSFYSLSSSFEDNSPQKTLPLKNTKTKKPFLSSSLKKESVYTEKKETTSLEQRLQRFFPNQEWANQTFDAKQSNKPELNVLKAENAQDVKISFFVHPRSARIRNESVALERTFKRSH